MALRSSIVVHDYIRDRREKKEEETFGVTFEAWFQNRIEEAGKRDMDNFRQI